MRKNLNSNSAIMIAFYLIFLTETGAYPPLALNSQLDSIQVSEWSHFELPGSEYYHEKGSLRFTLSFEETSESPLVLALSTNTLPIFNAEGTRVLGDYVDYNGWFGNKSKQFIIIRADTYNSTIPLYISVGRPTSHSSPVSFSLSSEYSKKSLCPNDCSGHGSCHDNICKCKKNFIDYDCGTPAIRITEDTWAKFKVPINSTRYGYFYIDDRKYLRLNFEWDGPITLISLNWRGYSETELPSETSYYSRTLLTSSDYCKEMIYSTININSRVVYMAIMNTYHPTEEVDIKIRLADDYTFGYGIPIFHVMIGTFTGIFLILLIAVTVRCKYADLDNFPAREPTPVGVPTDLINRTCPRVKYRDLEGDAESNCIVCLEEFKPTNKVRRLRCRHVFHARCIDEWFKSNVYCCLCKRDCSVIDEEFNVTGEHIVSSVL